MWRAIQKNHPSDDCNDEKAWKQPFPSCGPWLRFWTKLLSTRMPSHASAKYPDLSLIPYPTVNPHPKACWNSSIQRRGIRRSRNKNKEEMEELETQLKQKKKKRCRLVGQCQLHRLMFAPKTIISPKFKCQDFEKYDRKGVCTLISSFMVLLWPNMAMTTSCWFKHSQEVSLE